MYKHVVAPNGRNRYGRSTTYTQFIRDLRMEEPVDIPARSKPMPYITKTLTVSLKEATEQENN
jgi:hypothetical protein